MPIVGLEDKWQITAIVGTSLDGTLLPPQLLYEGLTPRFHPQVRLPSGWDIWHSQNHWSNEGTMLRFVDKVLVPCLEKRRKEIDARPTQHALLVFDVFKSHSTPQVLEKLKGSRVEVTFVPGNCTGELFDIYE